MIIQESQINTVNQLSLLDRFSIMEDCDKFNDPMTVPVIALENSNIINVENIINYAANNNIYDFGYALSNVCEANDLDIDSVVLSVFEESMILNEDLARFVNYLNRNTSFNVYLEHSDEVNALLNEDNNYGVRKDYGFSYVHSGDVGDKAETVANVSNLMTKDITNILDNIRKMENTEENEKQLGNVKMVAEYLRDYDGGRAAMNRHFLNNKGDVKYSGDFVGPSGRSYGFSKRDLDILKQASESDPINSKGEKLKGSEKYMVKYGSKMALAALKNDINNTEDNIDDIADRIKNEQIPRNIIARLIAKFRALYTKIMMKLKMGVYDDRATAAYNAKNREIDNEKPGFKRNVKRLYHLGKLGIGSYLRMLANKILWFIDKLLQKLQNTANTVGDKVKSWVGMSKYDSPKPSTNN